MLQCATYLINKKRHIGFFVYKIYFQNGKYYFGCTSNLKDRFKQHWFDANRRETEKGQLIKKYCTSFEELCLITNVFEVKQKKSMYKQERLCILLNNLDDNMINSVDEFNPFEGL